MRSTFSILFYINRSKVKADGTTVVLCRISIDGKQTVISTGIFCNPDDWNAKKGELKIASKPENGESMQSFQSRVKDTLLNLTFLLKRYTLKKPPSLKKPSLNSTFCG